MTIALSRVLSWAILCAIAILVLFTFHSPTFVYALSENTHSTDFEQDDSQYWSIMDASQTGLDFSTTFTIAFWINLESLPEPDTFYRLVNKWQSNIPDKSYAILIGNTDGIYTLNSQISSDGSTTENDSVIWTPSVNTWHHLALVYDGSANELRFYVDGSQQGATQTASASSLANSASPLDIGAGNQGSGEIGQFVDGPMDDMRVWDRALSSIEINDLYNNSCDFQNGTNLQGWWLFDNDGTDETTNGNDLTNNNSTGFTTTTAYECVATPAMSFVRKSVDESTNSTTLQDDDQLAIAVTAGRTYVVEGLLIASSARAKPDLKIGFTAPTGSDIAIGHFSNIGRRPDNGIILSSGAESDRIRVPARSPIPILIRGTLVASTSGTLQLQWARYVPNAKSKSIWARKVSETKGSITIGRGSFLQVKEL